MPLAEPVSSLLTEEWARFKQGVRDLDPDAQRDRLAELGRTPADPTRPRTVNLPGWDDVIKIPIGPRPTRDERAEFSAARRERRAPNLEPQVAAQIARDRARAIDRAQSAQPEATRAWTSILTAIDNVQDLVSTVSTLGRLTLWTAGALPGAAEAARLADRIGLLTAEVARQRGLAVTAPGALSRAAAVSELRAVSLELAAVRASYLSLGVIGRVALRAVPWVGYIILASDLLNLLQLIGMGASPLYALICQGPSAALAAGAPTLVFKRGLKRELTRRIHVNPVGREARAAARLKAMSGRIGVGALVEVAQTTDQLWGWGLSFGAIMGAVTEIGAALAGGPSEAGVRIVTPTLVTPQAVEIAGRIESRVAIERDAIRQAAGILQTAPVIMRVQQHFTTEEHLLHAVGVLAAVGIIADLFRDLDVDQIVADYARIEAPAPMRLGASSLDALREAGIDPESGRVWWLRNNPRTATLGAVMDDAIVQVPIAARDFLLPRRNTYEGEFYATVLGQISEHLWHLTAGHGHALHMRFAPDTALVYALTEDGLLVNANVDDPAPTWEFWRLAREYFGVDRRQPTPEVWKQLAAQAGITLIPMLPPTAPWPAAWA